MTAHEHIDPETAEIADSWSVSVTDQLEGSRNRAWIVAGVAAVIALLEAIAIIVMLPLKTIEPYTLLVDRQTGNVEALAPLDAQTIAPDAALTRSFLVQYVIARESYDYDNLQSDYRKVALWTSGQERDRYVRGMQSSNPSSPLSVYPRLTRLVVEVRSVSSLSADSALVRFSTTRIDRGAQPGQPQHWAAIINFNFTAAEMSAEDRLLNPLGFQVTRYRRDAETLPEDFQDLPQAPPRERPERDVSE